MLAALFLAGFCFTQALASSTRNIISIHPRAGENEHGEGIASPVGLQVEGDGAHPAAFFPEEQPEQPGLVDFGPIGEQIEGGLVVPVANLEGAIDVLQQHEGPQVVDRLRIIRESMAKEIWVYWRQFVWMRFSSQHAAIPQTISFEYVGFKYNKIIPITQTTRSHRIPAYLTADEALKRCADATIRIFYGSFNLLYNHADQGSWRCHSFEFEMSNLEDATITDPQASLSFLYTYGTFGRPQLNGRVRPIMQTSTSEINGVPYSLYVDALGFSDRADITTKYQLVADLPNVRVDVDIPDRGLLYINKDLRFIEALEKCADYATNNQPLQLEDHPGNRYNYYVGPRANSFNLIQRAHVYQCITFPAENTDRNSLNERDESIIRSTLYSLEHPLVATSADRNSLARQSAVIPQTFSISLHKHGRCINVPYQLINTAVGKTVPPHDKAAERFLDGDRSASDVLQSCARLADLHSNINAFNLLRKANQWVCRVYEDTLVHPGVMSYIDNDVQVSYAYTLDHSAGGRSCSVM